MSTISASYFRDANRVPITDFGVIATKSVTFTGSSATVNIPIFSITGTVQVVALYGIVTTVLGANHTASAFRLNDQTAQTYLTAVAGTDISAAPVGSMIIKNVLLATTVTLKSAAAGAVLEPTTVNQQIFSPIILQQKTAAVETDIEYHYATTDMPTSGVIQFFCGWLPISAGSSVTAL